MPIYNDPTDIANHEKGTNEGVAYANKHPKASNEEDLIHLNKLEGPFAYRHGFYEGMRIVRNEQFLAAERDE